MWIQNLVNFSVPQNRRVLNFGLRPHPPRFYGSGFENIATFSNGSISQLVVIQNIKTVGLIPRPLEKFRGLRSRLLLMTSVY